MTTNLERLNRQSGITEKLRIIHEDAIALLPNGRLVLYRDLTIERPLLVLNPDEFNRESIEALVSSRFYRRRFADFKTIPPVEKHMVHEVDAMTNNTNNGKALRYGYFNILPTDPITKQMLGSNKILDSERQLILMEHYDRLLDPFLQDIDNLTLQCQVAHRLAFTHPDSNTKKPPLDPIWLTITDEERVSRRKELRRSLLEMPPTLLRIPELKDAQIVDCTATIMKDNDGKEIGSTLGAVHFISNNIYYYSGGKGVIREDTANAHVKHRKRAAILEELVHYADAQCATALSNLPWSDNKEWIDSINQESLEAKLLSEKLMGIKDKAGAKASLFKHDSMYDNDHIPAEFLANLAQLDLIRPKGMSRSDLRELLPHTFPMYEQFMKSINGHILDRIKKERADLDKDTPVGHAL